MSGDGARTLEPGEASIPAGNAWAKWPKLALAAGIIGIVVSCGIKMTGDEAVTLQFLHSWLVAFMYCLSIALGCLFFVLIHFATKAGWSVVVRRIAEAGACTRPVFAL